MPSADTLLSVARGQIGYSRWDDPEPGTKYGRWYAEKTGEAYYGRSGVPYCAMFVSWCANRAGVSCAGLPGAYCPTMLQAGVDADDDYSASNAEPGDIVYFDWQSDGVSDHVGIVESNNGEYLTTIEGNTSKGSSGSQSNGGVVARRTRSYSVVKRVVRPKFCEDARWVSSKDGKSWWYDHGDGTYATSWEKIDGEWYFFGDDGWLVSEWLQRGKRWYYLNPNHDGTFGKMVTGWIQDDGRWYFSGNEGLVSGWQEIEDVWYRFEEAREGSFGSMLTGWTKSSGEWYWLWPDGHMGANEFIRTKGKAYLLGKDGKLVRDSRIAVEIGSDGAMSVSE